MGSHWIVSWLECGVKTVDMSINCGLGSANKPLKGVSQFFVSFHDMRFKNDCCAEFISITSHGIVISNSNVLLNFDDLLSPGSKFCAGLVRDGRNNIMP